MLIANAYRKAIHPADQVKAMNNRATASWGMSISDADFANLERGLDARWIFHAMPDKELSNTKRTNRTLANGTTAREATTDEELTVDEATTDEARFELVIVQGHISIRRSWSNGERYRLCIKLSGGVTNSAKVRSHRLRRTSTVIASRKSKQQSSPWLYAERSSSAGFPGHQTMTICFFRLSRCPQSSLNVVDSTAVYNGTR